MQRRKFILTTAFATNAFSLNVFAQNKNEPSKGFIIKSGQSRFGEKTIFFDSPHDIKVSSKDTNGELCMFEYTGNGPGGPPLHYHLYQDEVFYILEGEYIIQVGDDKFTASTGDTVFAPRKVPHAFGQISQRGKLFYAFQPAGKMEDFFRVISHKNDKPLDKIYEEHDMKIVGDRIKL